MPALSKDRSEWASPRSYLLLQGEPRTLRSAVCFCFCRVVADLDDPKTLLNVVFEGHSCDPPKDCVPSRQMTEVALPAARHGSANVKALIVLLVLLVPPLLADMHDTF